MKSKKKPSTPKQERTDIGEKGPKKPVSSRARKATGRQRKYVDGVLKGKTKKKAALDAGYAARTAEKPQVLEGRSGVQDLFRELMQKAGVTDELLARRIHQGLHAMETKHFQKDGIVIERRNLVSWSERREMLELALKLAGHLVEKHEHKVGVTLEELVGGSYGE